MQKRNEADTMGHEWLLLYALLCCMLTYADITRMKSGALYPAIEEAEPKTIVE